MAVKPLTQIQEDKKIENIIHKGAPVKEDVQQESSLNEKEKAKEVKEKKDNWTMISLRLPESLLEMIDANREDRFGVSRNTWILECIQEKLKK
jgi:predicted HicB family RNase H-like nuclease